MANVFISHRGADQVAAERLAEGLRDRGHHVWIDVWEIDLGDSIIEKIDTGLHESQFLLLCYSNASTMSPWMDREWMSSLARQLDGANIKILPVRLIDGTPPSILADIKYADLAADWQIGLDAICSALR